MEEYYDKYIRLRHLKTSLLYRDIDNLYIDKYSQMNEKIYYQSYNMELFVSNVR